MKHIHIFLQATHCSVLTEDKHSETGGPAQLPAKKLKKYFVLGWPEQPRQDKSIFYQPTNQPKKNPFHMYALSPHLTQFQQSAGDTPLWSLCPTWISREMVQHWSVGGSVGWLGGSVGWVGGSLGWVGGSVGWVGGSVGWVGGSVGWVGVAGGGAALQYPAPRPLGPGE